MGEMARSECDMAGQKESLLLDEKLSLVVGNNDCKYDDLAKILSADEKALLNWQDFAEKVGITGSKKLSLSRKKIRELSFDDQELFREMLVDWRGRLGKDATLSNLLRILMNLQWRYCADQIGDKFGLPPATINDIENERIATILVKDIDVVNNWQVLAKKLGAPAEKILQLENGQKVAQQKGVPNPKLFEELLADWQMRTNYVVTPLSLLRVLVGLKWNGIAGKIAQMLEVSMDCINNFQTVEVAKIMASDEKATREWTKLARKLTSSDKIITLQDKVNNEDAFPKTELFRQLIREWIATESKNANETRLLEILRSLDWRDLAANLNDVEKIGETLPRPPESVDMSSA